MSALSVCFYGTFGTKPFFFWEGGGTNAVHSSTPPRLLLWGELVALKRTKFFFFYEMKGRWMYQLLAENDCSLGRATK